MPSKRRLVTSEICFGTEKAGLLDFSYIKCALVFHVFIQVRKILACESKTLYHKVKKKIYLIKSIIM